MGDRWALREGSRCLEAVKAVARRWGRLGWSQQGAHRSEGMTTPAYVDWGCVQSLIQNCPSWYLLPRGQEWKERQLEILKLQPVRWAELLAQPWRWQAPGGFEGPQENTVLLPQVTRKCWSRGRVSWFFSFVSWIIQGCGCRDVQGVEKNSVVTSPLNHEEQSLIQFTHNSKTFFDFNVKISFFKFLYSHNTIWIADVWLKFYKLPQR